MILRVVPLQFDFRALDPISFPPGTAANVFRGAFGEISRRIWTGDAFQRIFAPKSQNGPSGLEDQPRPFVLRASSLDGQRFGAGERFTLHINTFDPTHPALQTFQTAFDQLSREGLGPGRPSIELIEAKEMPAVELSLLPPPGPVERIRVTFLTPTELKASGITLREPSFAPLFKRARDRVTSLISLYQPAYLSPIDFPGLGDRASHIRMTASAIRQTEATRRSTRTGQTHSLGGFTGEATFEGDLGEFLPYLEAAWWTGVGRLTVWGNGWLRTAVEPTQNVGGI